MRALTLRSVVLWIPFGIACGSDGGAAIGATTGESTAASTDSSLAPTSDDPTTGDPPLSTSSESTSTPADTSGESTSTDDPSVSSSSSESGDPPDCEVQEGCSCVFGLCHSDPLDPDLACEDDVCVAPTCGNGDIDGDEVCDDWNVDSTDDCTAECLDAACGDGSLYYYEEWCDGVEGSPCGAACDAQPTGWSSQDAPLSCALALASGGRAYAALGDPVNELRAFDAANDELWTVPIVDGEVQAVAMRGDEIVLGITTDPFGDTTSSLRRFDADGNALGDVALAPAQSGEQITDMRALGGDLWIATSIPFDETGHLCRYDGGASAEWCTAIVLEQDDDVTESVARVAVAPDGSAAVSIAGFDARVWRFDPDGAVVFAELLDAPPNMAGYLGVNPAFSADGQRLAVGFPAMFNPADVLRWAVYDAATNVERFGGLDVRDVWRGSHVVYAASGDLVIANAVDKASQYPWIIVESAAGEYRYTRRGQGVPGLEGWLCDLEVEGDEVVLLGITRLPERTFMTRFVVP